MSDEHTEARRMVHANMHVAGLTGIDTAIATLEEYLNMSIPHDEELTNPFAIEELTNPFAIEVAKELDSTYQEAVQDCIDLLKALRTSLDQDFFVP